tara:strand:+ start:15319 stop:16032 length:714 start_codon:yes stop_codon:yes gene_type:complete
MKKPKEKYVYSGKKELENSDKFLKNYNLEVVKIFFNHFESKGSKILDFGAGIGTLSILYEKMSGIKPVCVEIDLENRKFLKSKGFLVFKSIFNSKNNFDAVFSSNVLEHIENDQKTLDDIYKKLNKDGLLFLFLPAFEILYSDMDKKVGHFRRYSMQDIKKKLEKAKFKIVSSSYLDSLGFFASFAMKIIGYNENKGIGSPKSLKFYDKYIIPISFFLDRIGLRFFFGKNLILLAKK